MLDIVVLAMFAVVVALAISILLVRRGRYRAHQRIQLTIAGALVLTITAFEIDLRLFTDWEALARPSPFYASGWVHRILAIHLAFALPTPVVWIVVIWRALRRFPKPPYPAPHSRSHRFWGRVAAAMMVATAVTGWIFYAVAFIAT